MADEAGQSVDAVEIDLDNIEVDVLIICKNQNTLNQSSLFLTRRGWPTNVLSDVSRAVEYIAEKRPDFVLVSLSHTSPTINKLCDVITQTFNIQCIGFVEASDSGGAAKLANAKIRYKIQGSPSGPSIQRTLRKILAERFQISETEHEIDQAEVDAMLSGTEVAQSSKPRRTLKDIEKAAVSNATGNMLFGQNVESKRAPHVTRNPTADELAEMKKSLFGDEEMNAPAPQAVDGAGPQNLIEKAVEGAMSRLCQTVSGPGVLKLEEIVMAGVCPVESGDQSGYLVIVWQPPDQIAREEFLRVCEKEIQSTFAAMKVPGKVYEPAFWAHLPPIEFTAWAQACAQFSRMLAHQKREVGVAFFATKAPLVQPNPPDAQSGMGSIGLDKISTEAPVNFEAYIPLANSNRFFLYLREGRVLQPEQKTRLQERQVNEFFVKSAEIDKVRQYLAIAFLSGLIQQLGKKAA